MSSEHYLTLLLDAPMQSWGHSSRFQIRSTLLFPTKSGVIGILAAAMGINKDSSDEPLQIERLGKLQMISIAFPKLNRRNSEYKSQNLLNDFHTVMDTKNADRENLPSCVITRRHYLQDSRFGIILKGSPEIVLSVSEAI